MSITSFRNNSSKSNPVTIDIVFKYESIRSIIFNTTTTIFTKNSTISIIKRISIGYNIRNSNHSVSRTNEIGFTFIDIFTKSLCTENLSNFTTKNSITVNPTIHSFKQFCINLTMFNLLNKALSTVIVNNIVDCSTIIVFCPMLRKTSTVNHRCRTTVINSIITSFNTVRINSKELSRISSRRNRKGRNMSTNIIGILSIKFITKLFNHKLTESFLHISLVTRISIRKNISSSSPKIINKILFNILN